jgi:alpha-tubulin suppressor-like RCC1 family protein
LVALLIKLGEVYTWGTDINIGHPNYTPGEQSPKLVEALRNRSIRAIACGNQHLACLTDNGQVFTCGNNSLGQLGTTISTNKV